MRCLFCEYDLSHRPPGGVHRCPECGREFDPNDRSTFSEISYSPTIGDYMAVMGLSVAWLSVAAFVYVLSKLSGY